MGDSGINWAERILRKCAHVAEYAVLGALVCILAFRIPKIRDSRYFIMAFSWLITVMYAVTDEVHQAFVPGRGPSFRDVILDGLGALAGILIVLCVRFFANRNRTNNNRNMC